VFGFRRLEFHNSFGRGREYRAKRIGFGLQRGPFHLGFGIGRPLRPRLG
jgi:hypothetical protein